MSRHVAIQIVFYNQSQNEMDRLLACLTTLRLSKDLDAEVRTGNCGPKAEFDADTWSDRLAEKGFSHTHLRFEENLGFGKAHNRLCSNGGADAIWMLNPDTLFAAGTLMALAEFGDGHPGWGIIEPRLFPLEHAKYVDPATCQTGWCSGCAPLVDAALFAQIGGFDESFFLYSEDVDLSWRIKAAGGSLLCCPSASVYHHRREVTSVGRLFWIHVSELLLLRKYGRVANLRSRMADLISAHPRFAEHMFAAALCRARTQRPATERERAAASWSGRLNSPLRWEQPKTVPANAPALDAITIDAVGAESLDIVECALSAWGCGIHRIGLDIEPNRFGNLAASLPFPVSEGPAGPARVSALHRFLAPAARAGEALVVHTVRSGGGWLGSSIECPSDPPSFVERRPVEETVTKKVDRNGWKQTARATRTQMRLMRAPAAMKPSIRGLLRSGRS